MAVVALQHGMRANKREAILVIANLLQRNLPALHRVATFTIGAKLPTMDVGMAICTAAADLLKDQAHVAFGAGDFRVHPAQWVARLIVIELRVGADGFPACVCVTLLAWNRECSMWVRDFCLRTSDTRPRAIRRLL